MQQKHTEATIRHTDDQQDTGNHKKPGAKDSGGAGRFGGTRAGADNVEGKPKQAGGKDEEQLSEVKPARDERNRL